MKIFSFFLTLLFIGQVNGQIINTIAGIGISGFSGDNGPATAAQLNYPWDIVTDKLGNIYIADRNNYRIRKINNTGVITTIAGNGTMGFSGDGGNATSAQLGAPTGITIDSKGNIFFVDEDNNRIRKIDTLGIIRTIAGNGNTGYTGDGGPAIHATLRLGWSLASDSSGNIYIADAGNNVIRKVDTSGIIFTIAGNGTAGNSGNGGPAVNAELYGPNDVALDKYGNIYIADVFNNQIRKIDTAGIISRIAGSIFGSNGFGGDGGPATSALLSQPQGVTVDSSGNVYIADTYNNLVRIIDTLGIINIYAGNGSNGFSGDGGLATYATLRGTIGITVDNNCNLYIADYSNCRIRKVTAPNTSDIKQVTSGCKQIIFYPNPTNDQFYIETNSTGKIIVDIFDLKGRHVFSKVIVDKEYVNVRMLNPGVYSLTIKTIDSVLNRKLVIVR